MNKKTMADDLDPLSGFEDSMELLNDWADEQMELFNSWAEIDRMELVLLSSWADADLDLDKYIDEDLDRDAFMRCRLGR